MPAGGCKMSLSIGSGSGWQQLQAWHQKQQSMNATVYGTSGPGAQYDFSSAFTGAMSNHYVGAANIAAKVALARIQNQISESNGVYDRTATRVTNPDTGKLYVGTSAA